ncbi:hypothetical protein PAHAL_1G103800 [Panicum hallii]|uniref:Ephrin RBD domain-containing protein n=1 Tax=Panicum hallii TaxID=206008 RepID=A0A2T8KUV1_9POAL|nr:hypothetical protein PAHAL_1G103800 [Panicum hallii]
MLSVAWLLCSLLLLLLLCSRSGCGEFATLSAPAWLPKENGGSEGDVAFFPGRPMRRSTVELIGFFYFVLFSAAGLIWSGCTRGQGPCLNSEHIRRSIPSKRGELRWIA